MSYNMDFSEESNVAYFGTSEDLQFGGFEFMKQGVDMPLFGPPEPVESRLFSALGDSAAPATVSPQEITMAPPQSGYIPSSASIPELTPAESFFGEFSPEERFALFSNPSSADPSPLLQDNMAPSSAYQDLGSLFPGEEPYVPTGADLGARHTDSIPPPTPKPAVLGPAPSGVSKRARKSNRPLKEINLDEITDEKERKKAKNTEAARRSRAKRDAKEAELENKIEELKAQLEAEKAKSAQLQAYINGLPPQPF